MGGKYLEILHSSNVSFDDWKLNHLYRLSTKAWPRLQSKHRGCAGAVTTLKAYAEDVVLAHFRDILRKKLVTKKIHPKFFLSSTSHCNFDLRQRNNVITDMHLWCRYDFMPNSHVWIVPKLYCSKSSSHMRSGLHSPLVKFCNTPCGTVIPCYQREYPPSCSSSLAIFLTISQFQPNLTKGWDLVKIQFLKVTRKTSVAEKKKNQN